MMVTRGKGGGGLVVKDERIKYVVMKGDLTLGGKYTFQYAHDGFCNCTLETNIILLVT